MAESVQYQYADGVFTIQDPDLNINFTEQVPVDLPHVSGQPESGYAVVVCEHDRVVVQKSYYHDHLLHGPSYIYYDDGSLASERWFVKGFPHGRSIEYYMDGAIARQAGYMKGELHGSSIEYYPQGTKKWSGTFFHGKAQGKCSVFHHDGLMLRSTDFSEGCRHGIDVGWTEDGFLLFCELWQYGEKVRSILSDFIADALKIS